MKTIRELFSKAIDRKIEEVIKVDQAEETTVLEELNEYHATDAIKDHFRTVFRAIADAPSEPHEGIGVWVSGFFGSGKSSFAKILGYTVSARPVCGRSASQVFKENVEDADISALLDSINARIPTHAIIFDVSMDRGIRTASERITEVMYQAFLRELDYSEDFDLAELEMRLEHDGRLEEFEQRFEVVFKQPWKRRRRLGAGISEASRILHEMDKDTYPHADSWAKAPKRADVDANGFANRAFELMALRKPGHALIFVIDEVGQYVARSVDKMLDLQAVVQAFGIVGKNRVKEKKAVAPCWIIVTSQEKLNEVVDALEGKKTELARLQDRFSLSVDLKQSDISEVTSKRVLDKNKEGKEVLEDLYAKNEGRLKTYCALERTSRDMALTKSDFVNLYPYLPYQIDLCIDIVAGLRLKRGAQRHIGGSNRTIIKQAQQMLVHPRTRLADAPISTLVTLDRVYELLYAGNLLPTELTREVDDVPKLVPGNKMAPKVAKAIALLESVTNLPRTAHNLAVVLHPSVEADAIIDEVNEALKALEAAQVIRDSEDGYKLLTIEEKHWDTERSELEPKAAERNKIMREALGEIFSEPRTKNYRYKGLPKPFKLSVYLNGEAVDADGQVPFDIVTADDQDELSDRCKEARATSNEKKNEILWVVSVTEDIRRLAQELHRSREMVSRYEREQASGKLSADRSRCLGEEKIRRDRYTRDLRGKVSEALQAGIGFFRAVQKDGSALGRTLPEVLQGLLDYVIPDLYPKFEMGARQLTGDEAEKFLTAANLNGLPPIFYDGENGLSLVIKQGGKFVPNSAAEICKEVLDNYLRREHAYGNKVTGKTLEMHFQGVPYNWSIDILRLVLAVLLRGGAIEVTHQGRKHRNHNDPACREPFVKNPAFRSASFAPREALDLRMLADAARHYEEITGKEVDIEEGAIAQAFQRLAGEDREKLLPLVARMRALDLPSSESMAEYLQTVEGILDMPADDCVKTLAGEGKSYKEARARSARLAEATSQSNIEILKLAHRVLETQWPTLEARGVEEAIAESAETIKTKLSSETFYEEIEAIRLATIGLADRYAALYAKVHIERQDTYSTALDSIKGLPEWVAVSQDTSIADAARNAVLAPLLAKDLNDPVLPRGEQACLNCRATVDQMESDIAAVEVLKGQVIRRLQELAAPEEKIEYVRVASFFSGRMESKEDVETALETLKEHLLKLLAEGVRIVLE